MMSTHLSKISLCNFADWSIIAPIKYSVNTVVDMFYPLTTGSVDDTVKRLHSV